MKPNLFYLILIIKCLAQFANSESCVQFSISMTQVVELQGFKREIKWLTEIHSPDSGELVEAKCEFALRFVASSGFFVNPDELADLQRFHEISAYVVGDVDVEAPEHDSKEHVVYIFIPTAKSKRISITLPIHLRYQRAQIGGGFGKVVLPKPSLLTYIPNESKSCGTLFYVKGPSNSSGLKTRMWRNITYRALFEDVELFVPVGNLDHYPLVAIVTLLLGCCACIYILSVLLTAPF